MPSAAPWTFDARDRSYKPRGTGVHQQLPRTPKHHPNLKDLGHRFGPALCCQWCGIAYAVVCAELEPARCEEKGDDHRGN